MIDPIGAFYRIRDFYISYLETAFRIGDAAVSRERRALLEMSGELCTAPISKCCRGMRKYRSCCTNSRSAARKIPEIPGLSKAEREAFIELVLSGPFHSAAVKEARGEL